MHIVSVKHGIVEGYEVTALDGQIVHVPKDTENRDHAKVQKWESDGGTITAANTALAAPTIGDAIEDAREGDPVIAELLSRIEALEAV